MNKKINFTRKTLVISLAIMMISSIFVLPSSAEEGEKYDYVIITTNDIEANSQELQFFIKMKENNDHSVLVVTEDEFDAEGFTGQYPNDRADKIRQWLKDNDATMGIDYVLLIGDPDPDSFKDGGDSVGDIPMKMCYPRYFRVGDGAPTDLYYSDLDSEWDLDGDGFYHESLDYNNPTKPDSSVNADHFSVEWTGWIQIDHGGADYTFRVLCDDGVILKIDGTDVIYKPNKEGLSYEEGTVYLEAGLKSISLKLREKTDDAVCKLFWKTLDDVIENDIVPSSNLRYTETSWGGLNAKYYNNENWEEPVVYTAVQGPIEFIWGTGDMGTSDPNYTPEVYVGRIPVYNNDYEQLDKILRKIINYETDPGDISWRESVLLPMVEMNDITFSGGLGEAIKQFVAIPNGYSYYRIYEPEDAGFLPEDTGPTIEKVRDKWINGYGMVTWHTHGSETKASYVMNTANVGALDDTKPSFTMQASCHNAYPENPDNLAYSLLKHGAITTIAGTRMTTYRYGIYSSFTPTEYMNHHIAYYYTLYVMDDNMPAGAAYAKVVDLHSEPNSNAIEFNLYGDPECQLFTVNQNGFPTAYANGPYTGDEGSPITFDASGSVDPEAMPMEYRWDFDGDDTWDTDWSKNDYAEFTWGDDYSGTVKLEVRDEIGKTDISTTTVTISNVAPTTTFDTLGQPNPQFILPYQELTFVGSFTDPGWEDTHTASWDFRDTTIIEGDLTEENEEPDSTGITTAEHAYTAPGTYTVELTITDDDGDSDTDTMQVEVVDEFGALQDIDDYIQNLPDSSFKNNPEQRRNALHNKISSIFKMLGKNKYNSEINKLLNDIREKADGLIDGKTNDDWIIDYDAQYHICMKIDDLTYYLVNYKA